MKRCPTCESNYPSRFSVCPQDGSKLVESSGWSEGNIIRGKYRILAKVGQGGMGAVYKATHVTFEELRAIKVMNPELLGDALFVKRFKQEAVIARKLDHPNAVRVEDIDESEDGLPFMVMEFIEGMSLKELIEKHGPIPAARACSIIKQVAAALNAAHSLGMVHRDIKPANIVLIQTPGGEQAKVLDFGIAKIKEARSGDSGMTLTGTGIVIGTPQYMSPEQALGKRGEQLDGRSDLYSLGVVMYQMLTGELPFKTDTTMQLLLAHINTPPRPVLEAKPGLNIPPALARVVMRLLEKDPAARPQTGEALIQELIAAEEGREAPIAAAPVAADDGATMIASPAHLRQAPAQTQATPVPPVMPTATTVTPPLAAAVSPSSPVQTTDQGSRRSRAPVYIVAVIIVIALAAGGVWGGFHYGLLHRASLPASAASGPSEKKQPPSQPSSIAMQPAGQTATAAPATAAADSAGTANANESELPNSSTAQPKTTNSANRASNKSATAESPKLPKLNEQRGRPPASPTQVALAGPAVKNEPVSSGAPRAAYNPSMASVVITTAPGAQIYIDGKMAGTAGSSGQLTVQDLKGGVHSLRASLTGFNDIESNFSLPPGGTGFLNAKWGATQSTAGAVAPAASGDTPAATASKPRAASPLAMSFPVEYLHRLGSAKGLLVIEGHTVRYQPSNGKDAFTSPLTGINWGSTGGDEFYLRLAGGKMVRFRSGASANILAMLRRAASEP